MSPAKRNELKRLEELLLDRALVGLDAAAEAELELLREQHLGAQDPSEDLELLIAKGQIAQLEDPTDALPSDLMARLEAQARDWLGPLETPSSREPERRSPSLFTWLGWGLAAACLAMLLWGEYGPHSAGLTPDRARMQLIASAPDLEQLAWTATEDERVKGLAIAGDVVWSDQADQGYMLFEGLPPNDPTKEQYQLWIFDKERSAERPVDGGVFDITRSGQVVVPIDAKLPVGEAFLFGVTVERPGGVVVSEREHLVLLAQP